MDETFFYIVSQVVTTLVLENVGDGPDVGLALTEQRHDDRQLWKWNANGKIANKFSKYVMDVKTSLIKRTKTVIATLEKDDVNQGWYLLDDHIISNRNDLALEMDVSGQIFIKKVVLNSNQKWYLVPYDVWAMFRETYYDPISEKKVNFWANVAINNTRAMIGCTIAEYKQRVQTCVSSIEECAETLNSVAPKTGTAKIVGGVAGIFSGAAAITGIALVPVTAGTSLFFTIGGVVLGVGAGVTSATTTIINEVFDAVKKRKMKRAIIPALSATLCLQNLLNLLIASIRESDTPIKNANAINVAYKTLKISGSTGATVYNSGKSVKKVFDFANDLKGLKQIAKTADNLSDLKVLNFGLAADKAAPAFKLGSKTIAVSGSAAAKGISGSLATVGIFFGIWDIVSGAKQIKNKNELANVFLEAVDDIKSDEKKLLDIFKDIEKRMRLS